MPDVSDVVHIAANLFAAGQETTIRLLGSALQIMGDRPDLQRLLRHEPERIPNFVEETLRYESPVKGDFRLSRFTTEVGGVTIPAGSQVMVLNGAANRDPRSSSAPTNSRRPRERPRAPRLRARGALLRRSPPGAGRGPDHHRAAARSDERHLDLRGRARPGWRRRYDYAPTFILRGLNQLHLAFTPAS